MPTDSELKNAIQHKKSEAIEQLNKYPDEDRLKKMSEDWYSRKLSLKKIILIFHGTELVCCDELH
jgi:hypothetical protein